MRIAIIDSLGLCYDGNTMYKRGLGGSESSCISMSRELSHLGHHVVVYNDCESDDNSPGMYEGVEYKPTNRLTLEYVDYDVIISLRSVEPFKTLIHEKRQKFILWMHDTFCEGDEHIENMINDGVIDEVWTLSDFHTSYVTTCDHGRKRMYEAIKKNVWQTRNGINIHAEKCYDPALKDDAHFIYNASVTKGLQPLLYNVWPLIREKIPHAKLTVVGGYYRFREEHGPDEQENTLRRLMKEFEDDNNITFTGVITQMQIAELLKRAQFMLYPCEFPETFGISTLESLAYNTPVITCEFGALEETAIDNACYKLKYPIVPNSLFPNIDPISQAKAFAELTIKAYEDQYLYQQKFNYCDNVREICEWKYVALQWQQHLYHILGLYLPVEEYRYVQQINYKTQKLFGRRNIAPETVQPNTVMPKSYKIHVIVPVYNGEEYIEKCIRSIAAQDYKNYEVIIMDDASTDHTTEVIEKTLHSLNSLESNRFHVFLNDVNEGALKNQLKYMCKIGDLDQNGIIMLIDGDDSLVNDPNIFNMYNELYNNGYDFTYGSMWSEADNIPLIAQEYPPAAVDPKSVKFPWIMPYSHLRTFHTSLVEDDDFTQTVFYDSDKNMIRAGGDLALFYFYHARAIRPKAVKQIVYNYNDNNPNNDYKIHGDEQNRNVEKIMNDNFDEKTNVLIAIPTAKYIEADTFKSLWDLDVPEHINLDLQSFFGYRIDQVRNLICDYAIKNNYDYVLFVDSDVVIPSNALEEFLNLDSRNLISGAIYRQRNSHQVLEVYNSVGENVSYEHLIKTSDSNGWNYVSAVGFGCVLVPIDIIKTIGYPQFEYHHAIDHKDTISEDWDFCRKAINAGFEIVVNTDIILEHIGSSYFVVDKTVKK